MLSKSPVLKAITTYIYVQSPRRILIDRLINCFKQRKKEMVFKLIITISKVIFALLYE